MNDALKLFAQELHRAWRWYRPIVVHGLGAVAVLLVADAIWRLLWSAP